MGDVFGVGFVPGFAGFASAFGPSSGRRRRRQWFESGELKYVILELLREKPRHGYDIIKALGERLGGCYTPSAGAVYPTLQLLEDQGYVKARDVDGRRVYSITKEGEAFLEQHRDTVDDIFDRVQDVVHGFAGGKMGELHEAFAKLAGAAYRKAWRLGPDDPELKRIAQLLRQTADEIEAL